MIGLEKWSKRDKINQKVQEILGGEQQKRYRRPVRAYITFEKEIGQKTALE